jgi:hypothetical protein
VRKKRKRSRFFITVFTVGERTFTDFGWAASEEQFRFSDIPYRLANPTRYKKYADLTERLITQSRTVDITAYADRKNPAHVAEVKRIERKLRRQVRRPPVT